VARLEELTKGAVVRGLFGDRRLRIVDVAWHGASAITLTYTDELTGRAGQELLYRDDEPRLSIERAGRAWSMDGDARHFRLASEAKRISLAYLFDPFLAVQASNLDPLPHQIDAVYNRMLPLQPLRFLLADDPGAGKTIMAGLLCKELMIRGDVERCLVIAPGSLVEQWQDELEQKFALDFRILTRDMIEATSSGNPFAEQNLLIARLDHLARNEELQARLRATDWDLVIVDEAHKMSAHYTGGEIRETRRYRLGQLAGAVSRHLLLMTATPHAGIDADYRLFLRLLDADRFDGRPRAAARTPDVSDVMRRLVKEKLLTFDGRPLFPERRAYTVAYPLSEAEASHATPRAVMCLPSWMATTCAMSAGRSPGSLTPNLPRLLFLCHGGFTSSGGRWLGDATRAVDGRPRPYRGGFGRARPDQPGEDAERRDPRRGDHGREPATGGPWRLRAGPGRRDPDPA